MLHPICFATPGHSIKLYNMIRLLIFLLINCCIAQTNAQFVHKIKADSVLITNDSCTAELNLENSTKHIKGFLYNKGNGRTEFRKSVMLNDSTFVFGEDTLVIRGSGGKLTNGNGTKISGTWPNQSVGLGGSLTRDDTIYSSTNGWGLTMVGVNSGRQFEVRTTGHNGTAIMGLSGNNGIGVSGYVTGFGWGVGGYSTNGIGVFGQSDGSDPLNNVGVHGSVGGGGSGTAVRGTNQSIGGSAFLFDINRNDNTTHKIGAFRRNTLITAAPGIGSIVDFEIENAGGSNIIANRFISKLSDAGTSTYSSDFEIWGANIGSIARKLLLQSNGQLILDGYTSLTKQTDTASIKPLGYNISNGSVVPMANWPGSNNGFVPRVSTTTSSSTITPNALTDDVYAVTALAQNTTIAAPTGTFHDGQIIILRLKDNGTSRTILWNSTYRGGTDFSLPISTGAGKTMYITFIWNAPDLKLDAVGLSKGY
jgi:hypothetical protein